MTSLHVGKNDIPEKEMREIMAIAMRMGSMKILCEIPFKDKTLTELAVSGKNLGTEGALVVAEYLDGNGAMLSLDISSNSLAVEGTKLLAKALESNQTMTSLNISSHSGNFMTFDGEHWGHMSGVAALAGVIPGMLAMTSLDVSENDLCAEGTKLLAEALKGNQIMMELNISSNNMTYGGMSGVVALAGVIPDMEALTSLNISDNDIGKLSPDAAKLDAAGSKFKKAKSGNMTYFKDGKGQREAPTECNSPLGTIALANAIPDMRALTKLDISRNYIGAEQEGGLERICVAGGIELAK
jgi:Leucine-rich repeat (LRR) protein